MASKAKKQHPSTTLGHKRPVIVGLLHVSSSAKDNQYRDILIAKLIWQVGLLLAPC